MTAAGDVLIKLRDFLQNSNTRLRPREAVRIVVEAADEIERLRAECLRLHHAEAEAMAVVLSLESTVERLRAEVEQLRDEKRGARD
jgi:hypothetical protein